MQSTQQGVFPFPVFVFGALRWQTSDGYQWYNQEKATKYQEAKECKDRALRSFFVKSLKKGADNE